MSVIFQLFCAEDLKKLSDTQLNELKELITQEVKDSQDPSLDASLEISRLIQNEHMQRLLPGTSPPTPGTYDPPITITISPTQAVEIPQTALATLRKRLSEVFQQLTSAPPHGSSSSPTSPMLTPTELLDQLLSPEDFAKLAATAGNEGYKILAWALTCELANFKIYGALQSVKQRAEEKYMEFTGQRPKGPDSLYSPFYPLSPLYER
jgi:hypothetical protein